MEAGGLAPIVPAYYSTMLMYVFHAIYLLLKFTVPKSCNYY